MNSITCSKRISLVIAFIFSAIAAAAQFVTDNKRSGDKFYAKGDYYSAAQYYEKAIGSNTIAANGYEPYNVQKQGSKATVKSSGNRVEIVYRLAESYRQVNDHAQAAKWYAQLLQAGAAEYPYARYHYAASLRANGKYDEAAVQLEQFIHDYKTEDAWSQKAKQELANLQFIRTQLAKPAGTIKVEKLATGLQESTSYAATAGGNSAIVFTSTYSAQPAGTKLNALYTGSLQNGTITNAQKITLDGTQHQGAASVSADGNRMFFTQWMPDDKGKNKAAIYMSAKNGEAWATPVLLNGNVNATGSDNKQPHLTSDGKGLLFSSNRAGGVGGFDIWYVSLDNNGNAGNANPLSSVNTAADEEAPFYHDGTKALVFATNGRTGMGGFDLFEAKGAISSLGTPVNLGYPVNSVKDDIYFSSRSALLLEDAWVSSDRNAVCCLELFRINKSYRQYYVGKVIDCQTKQPLQGVEVVVNGVNKTLVTDADGSFMGETGIGAALEIKAAKNSFETGSVASPASYTDTVMLNTICLVKKPDPFQGKKELVTHDIYFNFNSAEVLPTSYAWMDELVTYLKDNPTVKLEIAAHTDGIGAEAYNRKLSQQRADACVDHLTKAGISPDRLVAVGKGECCPLQAEKVKGKDNPDARQQNRRVEFKIVD